MNSIVAWATRVRCELSAGSHGVPRACLELLLACCAPMCTHMRPNCTLLTPADPLPATLPLCLCCSQSHVPVKSKAVCPCEHSRTEPWQQKGRGAVPADREERRRYITSMRPGPLPCCPCPPAALRCRCTDCKASTWRCGSDRCTRYPARHPPGAGLERKRTEEPVALGSFFPSCQE